MILAVDLGNTHTVFGMIEENGDIIQVFRLETNRNKTSYEYAASIYQILQILGIDNRKFSGAILSCVVPDLRDTVKSAIKVVTGKPVLVVGAGMKTGLRILTDDPGAVAADLVSAAVGAKLFCHLPCIIVDMGTATTVTVVNESGSYIGGAIMPGLTISMQALSERTSLLPSVDLAPPKKVIATATMDSMRSGLIYGAAGAIDGIIDRFQTELEDEADIVATGGLSTIVCRHCRHEIRIEKHLLLKGLWSLWKMNREWVS